jgi:hypothetical protein
MSEAAKPSPAACVRTFAIDVPSTKDAATLTEDVEPTAPDSVPAAVTVREAMATGELAT